MSLNTGCATFGQSQDQDPFLWLEEVESDKALSWARQENEKTLSALQANPIFASLEKEALQVLSDQERLTSVRFRGSHVFDFWTDEKNPRGLLRRTTYENYKSSKVKWEIVLDLDQLNATENKSWVYRGCRDFRPDSRTCLIFLSDGGTDAVEVREFDLTTKKFVPAPAGFWIPKGKSYVAWVDQDTLLVATSESADTLTKSGLPLQIRHWKRGTELLKAPILFKTTPDHMMVTPFTDCSVDSCETFVADVRNFFQTDIYWWKNRQELVKVDLPPDYLFKGLFRGEVFISLMKDLKIGEKTFLKGSLLKAPLGDWKNLTEVFVPKERVSFQGVHFSRSHVYLSVLENVRPRVYRDQQVFPEPDEGITSVVTVDRFSDRALFSFESPLAPPSYYEWQGSERKRIKSQKSLFDADRLQVQQLEAVAQDGTKIPYFLIRSKYSRGPAPTIVTAYGGFQIPMYAGYMPLVGKSWLERGGQFVIANIRGGGEFGPSWHQAAIREKRQVAFNDFYAVTEDLYRRALSTAGRTGFMGGSNGGLLAGVALTQRPDLFNAILIQVPLLDMLRYHKLPIGEAWVAEYGNPEDPKDREFISRYSPYQNVEKLVQSPERPEVFITTSTKDDRVHPGHARKFAARLQEKGIPYLYYENIEGGHGGAADLRQMARKSALQYTFFLKHLGLL